MTILLLNSDELCVKDEMEDIKSGFARKHRSFSFWRRGWRMRFYFFFNELYTLKTNQYQTPIMKPFLIITLIVSVTMIISCGSNEIGNSKDVNPQSVYFDYKIWGEEGRDNVTVLLQFRFAGPNGTTLVLDDPAKVELDGKKIPVDSSRLTGAYYEVSAPVKDFGGKHSIVFTDLDQKQYKEEFEFQPISLKTQLPDTVKRTDLVFDLDGLDPLDYVRVLLTDTAFTSTDINRVDTVRNGRIVITKEDLQKVVNGPVYLELSKEEEKPVKNSTREGGHLSLSYGIKRDFTLQD
jgi:hypothetical protein